MEERSDVKNKLEEGVRNEMMSNKQGAQNYRWVSTSLPPIYPPQGETRRCLLSTTFSIKCSWCCEWKAWRIPCMECWLAAKASLLFSVNLSTWWTWSFRAEASLVNLMGVSLVSPWKVEGEYKETRLVRPRGAAGNPPRLLESLSEDFLLLESTHRFRRSLVAMAISYSWWMVQERSPKFDCFVAFNRDPVVPKSARLRHPAELTFISFCFSI